MPTHETHQKKLQINLLTCETNAQPHRDFLQKKALLDSARGVLLTGLLLLFCVLGATGVFSYYSSQDEHSYVSQTWNEFASLTKLTGLQHFTNAFSKQLNGEDERINILMLGIGGAGHEGPQLADTIILLSIEPKEKHVALFSIPRDLVVSMEQYGIRKINNANAFGEEQQAGWGGEFARKVLEKTFDVPIQYYVRIDFAGFAKLIDAVGGVKVNVEHAFTDYTYPTEDKKYQTISFVAGEQTMDGDTALKFVRSRHSIMNNEGSDFSRGKRQQKVILALKEKITSREIMLNPSRISEILSLIKENVATNIAAWEVARFLALMKDFDLSSISMLGFDDSPQGLLRSSMSPEGAYILEPRDTTFEKVQKKIKTVFEGQSTQGSSALAKERPVISVKNGTLIEGLATRTAKELQEQGFVADFVGNAQNRETRRTILYDFTATKKSESLTFLQKKFSGSITGPSSREEHASIPESDFLVILGQDAKP